MSRWCALVPLFSLALALAACSAQPTLMPARTQFIAIDLHAHPTLEISRGTSPAEVAIHLAQTDFGKGDTTFKATHVYNGGAIVIVDSGNLEDDSIAGVQYRVDLSGLEIVWAGKRWHCRRPQLHWIPPGSVCA
jgi:hypothetical protein